LSLGGDSRIGHIRGRILTMFGEFATTTPRNDGSTSRGQWDLRSAYRYISEGWGGYHFDNVGHGLNIDAGIFVSYIGLFSYYNFDNWTYQPSYVSSNTPWFFNGLRIQYFPTAKLKIEPWIINGWQSYARFNSKPGLGGQILWRPEPWLSFVFNNYGMGTDVLGSPATSRIHTDDSVEIRQYNNPSGFLDMAAISFTADAGCQYGGGQNCFNNKNGGVKTMFLGWMAYERLQFAHDHYGITLGGGQMTNPGRYLTLLPPINGADAISGSPYFTANLGDKAHMYDATATFDYMPSQWLTFRAEMGYRHSDVPYFSGRGGITPPGGLNNAFGNTGSPGLYVCTNGLSSVADNTLSPSGAGFFQSSSVSPLGDNLGPSNSGGPVDASCAKQQGAGWYAWAPDLRKGQVNATFAIMTRF
jgi:Putative beta-barrel porin-2, OmpL-like. bbp2